MLVEKDDEALLSLFQNKATRNEGFKSILSHYSQPVYYFLRKMGLEHEDADEILQDLFVEFSGTAILNDTIRVTLYRLAATYCLEYMVKHKTVHLHALTSEQLLVMVLKMQEEFDFPQIALIMPIHVTEVRGLFKTGVSKTEKQITQ